MRFPLLLIALCLAVGAYVFMVPARAQMAQEKPENLPRATLAGGCFWCVESEFRGRKGVVYTIAGYTGGITENPAYQAVVTGKTGHAEAVEIYFDPAQTSYREILTHFLTAAHDPTQLNRQGVDIGTQYRSAIFYHDAEQKREAERLISEMIAKKTYKKPIVTEVKPAGAFWPAEEYHQQYYEKYEKANGQQHIRVWLKRQSKKAREE